MIFGGWKEDEKGEEIASTRFESFRVNISGSMNESFRVSEK